MLYTLNLDRNNDYKTIIEKGILCIDKGLENKIDDFTSYKEELVKANIFNMEDASLFIENIKGLKACDVLLIKVDDKFLLAEVKKEAELFDSLIYIKVLAFDCSSMASDLDEYFDNQELLKRVDDELSKKIQDKFDKIRDRAQDIKYEIVKAENSLMKIKKENKRNREYINQIKEGSKGELIIELDPPEYKDTSLPTIYESEENLEEMYLDLLKNQINFCLKLQEMTTKELIKTQELFNKLFRKNTNK